MLLPPSCPSSIRQSIRFEASRTDVWQLFTTALGQRQITGSDVEWTIRPGSSFELFGGACRGRTLTSLPPKLLVQEWSYEAEHWPEGHVSVCQFEFSQELGFRSLRCRLELTQVGIPEACIQECEERWTRDFWRPMKTFLAL